MKHAGELDTQLTIQRATRTSDGGGGFTESWATLYTVWARLEAMTGDEVLHADRVQAQQRYKVTVRAQEVPALRASDRVLWGTIALNIRSLPDPGRGLWRELICEAGVGTHG